MDNQDALLNSDETMETNLNDESGESMSRAANSIIPIQTAFSLKDTCPFKVQNVVSTVDLKVRLNLEQVAMRTRNTEYAPKRFPGLFLKLTSPRSTALIFSTGKIIISGSKSIEISNLAARKVARIMQRIGFERVTFNNFKVCNMVASFDVKFPINLDKFDDKCLGLSSYEPELFPALFFRLLKPKVTILIFVSGKAIITGAKSLDDINKAIKFIFPLMKQYRKPISLNMTEK